MNRFGVGVIGAGRIARGCHLPALSKLTNVELISVTDIDEKLAKAMALKFKAKKHYTSIEETFKDTEIDGVIICLPHNLHCQTVLDAAKQRKHILVEKPMALTLNEADRMVEAAKDNNVTLMAGHVYRFTHSYIKAKELLETGVIGKPIHAVCERYLHVKEAPTGWWRSKEICGDLVVTLNGPHHIDIALWLLASKAKSVYAQTLRHNPNWEGEDEATIQIRLVNESLATVLLSFNSYRAINRTFIIGSNGTMTVEEFSQLGESVSQVSVNGEIQNIGSPVMDRFTLQMKEFVDAAILGKKPPVTPEDARETVRVMESALRSASTNSVVHLTC